MKDNMKFTKNEYNTLLNLSFPKVDTLTKLFNLGMMRNYSEIIPDVNSGIVLNLGPGNKHIDGAIELEYPKWDAESMPIPFANNSVSQIHAYHFFEHIKNVPFLLSECNRVLIKGGHINIVVPYYNSQMQAQDLDHKSAYCETTFKVLFDSDNYKKGKVAPMWIATNFIMGDSERTLCLIVQLEKMYLKAGIHQAIL